MYKAHLLKIWGSYCDSFQNGGLWSYGFHEIAKISKAKNTTIKNNIHDEIIDFNTNFFTFL